MTMYVDGAADAVDREWFDAHLRDCPTCAGEVGDLRQFKALLASGQHASEGSGAVAAFFHGVWGNRVAWLAVPAVAVAAWFLIPRTNPAPRPETSQAAVPSTEGIVTLRDGGQTIAIDRAGNLEGLATLPAGDRTLVARALSRGRVDTRDMTGIRLEAGALMGTAPEAAAFGVLAPVGTAVESDRPEFSWRRLEGATGYVVSVYDQQFNKVLESPTVTEPRWVSPRAVDRGRVYSWQVRGLAPGKAVTAPLPPSPEARFAVITAAQSEGLSRARALSPPSRLLLATLYAGAGLIDEAEAELRALRTENPSAPIVASLIDSLRSPK